MGISGLSLLLTILVITLVFHPEIFFPYRTRLGPIDLYSDTPMPSGTTQVLERALAKIRASDLFDSTLRFEIHACRSSWRFRLFSLGNPEAGAVTWKRPSAKIFVRPGDWNNDRILPPASWIFARAPGGLDDRPLHYFLAHEMTHALQAASFPGRNLSEPAWLSEGYADYVGKGASFDFEADLALWRHGDPRLDPRNGLYRLHHLKVAYLLDRKHLRIRYLYRNPPDDSATTLELRALASAGTRQGEKN